MLATAALVVLLFDVSPACRPAGDAAFDEHNYDQVLSVILVYYSLYSGDSIVNSGPAGMQSSSYRLKADGCRAELAKLFYTPEGAAYLTRIVGAQTRQTNLLAILELLYESDQPTAIPVFETYSGNSNRVVANRAKWYLKKAKKKHAQK